MNLPFFHRNQSPRLCTLLMLAAGGCISHSAHATILSWINASGGSAAIPTNWTPNQIPTSADDLQFNVNAAYSVTFPVSLTTGRSFLVNRGTVTANFVNFTTTSSVSVAQTAGITANFNITGNLTSQSFFTLAINTGTTSASTINSVGATPSVVRLVSTNMDAVVGQGGTATLQIANNSQFLMTNDADDFIIGNVATGIGSVLLRSTTTSPASLVMNAASTSSDLIVGALGQGTLELDSHSLVNLSANCFVAQSPGSTGNIFLKNTLTSIASSMIVSRDLHVGHNTTAIASGNGALTIDDDGSVHVGQSNSYIGTAFLGDPNGGSGTLTLNRGVFSTENLVIDPTNGFLDHTGGRLRLLAGGNFSSPELVRINGFSSLNTPTVELIDHTTAFNGGFVAGDNAFGTLEVHSGSTVTYGFNASSPTQGKMIADGPLSRGVVTISGPGTTFHETAAIPTPFVVGRGGNATLTVSDSASLRTSGNMQVAVLSSSVGTFEVTSLADARVSNALTIGGEIGTGGVGTLTMSSSATLTVNSLTVHRTGTAALTNSTLNSNNTVVILNQMTAVSSTINTQFTELVGTLNATGTLNSDLLISNTGTLSVSNGTLFAGQAASDQGFHSEGLVTLNNATLTILDDNSSPMGNLSSTSGTLNASHALNFHNNATVSGSCAFFAPTNFLATQWSPSNTSGGLSFNAPVTATAIDATGGSVTFAAGSSLTAAGFVRSIVTTEEEAPIVANGDLELGSNSVNLAINLAGHLTVGAHRVNLYSNSTAHLGTLTTLSGGTLDGPDSNPRIVDIFGTEFTVFDSVPLSLEPGDVIEGFGTILTQVRTSTGSRLTLTGDLTMEGTSAQNTVLGFGNTFVSWSGLLEVGPHTLTIHREHRPTGMTTISGGTISGLRLTNLGVLSGHGTIENPSNATVNGGLLSITGQGAQEMVIVGGFVNRTTSGPFPGTINLRIGGDQGEENDRLIIASGDLALGGTLEVTTFGLAPDPDFLYEIITVQSGIINGQFEEVILPPGMTIQYDEGRIYITGICFADFNQDGGIDGSDIDAFFLAWEAGDFSADVNDDGGVDGSDVDRFFQAWEAGAC